jgi:hypothetical protein
MKRYLLAIGALLTPLSLSAGSASAQSYGTYSSYADQLPRYAKDYAADAERLYQADIGRQQAYQAYLNTRARVERNLFSSLGLDAAKARLSDGLDRFEQSRADALAKLKTDSAYQDLQARSQAFADQIHMLRQVKPRPQSQIDRLAIDKLESAKQLTAMEAAVLERDNGVQQAKMDMIAARADIARLDGELRAKLDSAAEVVAARDRLNQIDASIAKARIDYAGSRAAYVTVAEELDRQDWFRYHRGYYDYGYNYYRPHYHRYNTFFGFTVPHHGHYR